MSSLQHNLRSTLPFRRLRRTVDYRFESRWHVRQPVADVAHLFLDTPALTEWWSVAFLNVKVLSSGRDDGVGRVFELVTRGWLPYLLRFRIEVVATQFPCYFRVHSTGDFVGVGEGRLKQVANETEVAFNWQLSVEKPLLRYLSPIARPILRTNHVWMMRRGEEGINRFMNSKDTENEDCGHVHNIAGFRFAQSSC